jgi:hypothetical protein
MVLAPSTRRLRWEATATLRALALPERLLARWRPDVRRPDAMPREQLPTQR